MQGKREERIEDPVRILDRRLASGEIDRADHEALKRLILAKSSGRRTGPGRVLSTSRLAFLVVLVVVSAVAVASMALTHGPWRATPDGTAVGDGWPWGGGGMGPGMGGRPGGFGTNNVAIVGYAYSLSEVTVSVGTTITWVNMDGVMHTVSFGGHGDDHQAGPGVDSGPLYHMDVWSYTFVEPGTYEYHCDPHPYMTGTVIVEG